MRVLHCKKCGVMVGTDEAVIERMLDEVRAERNLARKDRKNAPIHLQNAKQMQGMITQIQSRYGDLERRKTICSEKYYVLKEYLLENNIVSKQEIREVEDMAEQRAVRKNMKDEQEIQKLLKSYDNYTGNKTKADPTADRAIRRNERDSKRYC